MSLPYSVYHGGYWSLLAMVGVAWICNYTGQILISCLYEPHPSTGVMMKVRYSYVDIAEYVWGKRYGGRLLFVAQNIELLMTCNISVFVSVNLKMIFVDYSGLMFHF